MANAPDMRAQREAAERIEQGIERYASGDVAASAREFEEALKLQPGSARATQCLAWVKDLQSGKRSLPSTDKLDADLLDAVAEALSDPEAPAAAPGATLSEEEQTREKGHLARTTDRAEPDHLGESPWDPVPLTPGHVAAPRASVAPPAESTPPPRTGASSSTLLGVAPPGYDMPLLTPTGVKHKVRPTYSSDENTGLHTREWRGTPTGTNLPPLDVPELSDQQIQELLALDGSPQLEVPEQSQTLELEAEPTPAPHPNPLRKKDDTTPDSQLGDNNFMDRPLGYEAGEFDSFENTPTRERGALLEAITGAPQPAASSSSDDELQLPPLESPRGRDDALEDGTNPTNPFVNLRMAEYVSYSAAPRDEELPMPPGRGEPPRPSPSPGGAWKGEPPRPSPSPGGAWKGEPPRPSPSPALSLNDTHEMAAREPIAGLGEAIERNDALAALELAEAFVTQAGALEAEACKPQARLLERAYELAAGPLESVPTHGQASGTLDPHSAFLLSRLDGMTNVDDLLDVSGMPRLHALRLLALLIRRGIVILK